MTATVWDTSHEWVRPASFQRDAPYGAATCAGCKVCTCHDPEGRRYTPCPEAQERAQRPKTLQEASQDLSDAWEPLRAALERPVMLFLDWAITRVQAWDRALKRTSR